MNLEFFILSLICAFLVYVIEGLFLVLSLGAFDVHLSFPIAVKYSFLINSLGYLVSMGGLTPFATQVYILNYENISARKATLTRTLQVVLFNLLFNILLILGFVYLICGKHQTEFNLITLIIALFVFLIFSFTFYLTIFWKKFRKFSIGTFFTPINKIISIFSKKKSIKVQNIHRYIDDFQIGFTNLIHHPRSFILIILLTIIDWLLWIGVLYFSFKSMDFNINPGYLLIGFAIGQTVAIISMVPGGAGTMEGSMALVYTAFGVPFETAIGAVLLYRVTFYIIPFIVSLPLYLALKKKVSKKQD